MPVGDDDALTTSHLAIPAAATQPHSDTAPADRKKKTIRWSWIHTWAWGWMLGKCTTYLPVRRAILAIACRNLGHLQSTKSSASLHLAGVWRPGYFGISSEAHTFSSTYSIAPAPVTQSVLPPPPSPVHGQTLDFDDEHFVWSVEWQHFNGLLQSLLNSHRLISFCYDMMMMSFASHAECLRWNYLITNSSRNKPCPLVLMKSILIKSMLSRRLHRMQTLWHIHKR